MTLRSVTDPRLTPEKRAESRYWLRARDMLRESPLFQNLAVEEQDQAVDRAWQIAEHHPISYAVTQVLLDLHTDQPPDLSDVSTAALLAEIARRIDR